MPSHDSDEPIRGNIRSRGFRRVSHGLFLVERDLEPDVELVRDLRAWLGVLPKGARFTHVTGALLRGWHLPKLPEQVPVFASAGSKDGRPRRMGLICSRLVHEQPAEHVRGLPVEPATEILLRAARDLGTIDLTILIDSARRAGDIDAEAMDQVLGSRRPGVRNLRAAWLQSSQRAESPGETLLRLFDKTIALDVEPQVELFDEAGNSVGRVDLWVVGTNQAHEYDGAHHRDKAQHRVDLRRERALGRTGFARRGFTLDDLLNHPAVTMHEIDRDLGRSHDPALLAAWRALVDNSLYSEVGRQRLMNRWHRQMGVVDWSKSA